MAKKKTDSSEKYCLFCNTNIKDVDFAIQGIDDNVLICDACIGKVSIIAESKKPARKDKSINIDKREYMHKNTVSYTETYQLDTRGLQKWTR